MKRILYVEASALLSRHLTGIGRLVARLIQELAHEVQVHLTTTVDRETAKRTDLSSKLTRGWEIRLTTDRLPREVDARRWVDRVLDLPKDRFDPVSASAHPILFSMLRPGVRHFRRELCMLYDFTPLLTPKFHTEATISSFGSFFSEATGLCDAAIAISEATRRDATWLAGIEPELVHVHYPGPSQCVQQHAHQEMVKRREDLILVVATLEPRKNAQFVLDWFTQTKVLPESMKLCWVGPPGWLPALGKVPRALRERVTFPGVISDAKLCRLYQEATFSIYPSLYEGFGLPVLDSLWHGCPVASSFHSSLMEFDTPGVFFFDPCDPDTLDQACQELLSARQEVCIDREDLGSRYNWNEMARGVMRLAFDEREDRFGIGPVFASADKLQTCPHG